VTTILVTAVTSRNNCAYILILPRWSKLVLEMLEGNKILELDFWTATPLKRHITFAVVTFETLLDGEECSKVPFLL
jgi:hypothetical protein